MATKLYVGSLPYRSTDQELKEAFEQFGSVESVAIIHDRETGRSKGFGFVEMSSEDEAKAAIEGMDGKEFGGRTLVVNEARPMTDRPKRDFNQSVLSY